MPTNRWRQIPEGISGPSRPIVDDLASACDVREFPDLGNSDPLYVFSDYGGEHAAKQGAHFHTYSFFLCDLVRSREAVAELDVVRLKYLENRRSLDFKSIDPGGRTRAIVPFWHAVQRATGLCVTIAVERSLGSLVRPSEVRKDNVDHALVGRVSELAGDRQEQLHRLLHFLALLLMGSTVSGQHVWWVTDQDKIIQDHHARRILQDAGANLLGHYVLHPLKIDVVDDRSLPPNIKPLMWVPDQLAGALAEVLSKQKAPVTTRRSGLHVINSINPKTLAILDGAMTRSDTLRSVAVSLRDVQQDQKIGHGVEWNV